MDAAQRTELEKPKVTTAWFVEFFMASTTIRLCSYGQTFHWNGYDWLGFGSLGSITPINESAGFGASPMVFGLNSSSESIIALATGPVEQYRWREVKLYFCPLDDAGRLVGEPELCWSGVMDTMGLSIDGEEGSVGLRCESTLYGMKRKQIARLNDAQQRQRTDGADTSMRYINALISKPQVWLSKKFQQI